MTAPRWEDVAASIDRAQRHLDAVPMPCVETQLAILELQTAEQLVGDIQDAALAALAEQAAGEAERVREAVAAEREACAVLCETWTDVYPGASYARGCAARIRARATSTPEAAPVASAERAVVEAPRCRVRPDCVLPPGHYCECVISAARKGGGK